MTDRAREAAFSILSQDLPGARVLDLFCGSGSLSCEALSRGAAEATLVDRSAKAVRTAEANLEKCGFPGRFVIYRCDVGGFLKSRSGEPADLVFFDPPYALSDDDVHLLLATLAEGVERGGIVVVHREAVARGAQTAFDWPSGYRSVSDRVYGGTALHFGTTVLGADARGLTGGAAMPLEGSSQKEEA